MVLEDTDTRVNDLRELADMGAALWNQLNQEEEQRSPAASTSRKAKPPAMIKFAYEAIPWAPHISTFDRALNMVGEVDRPNFGVCIDTFNIAASLYAAPELFPDGIKSMGEFNMRSTLMLLGRIKLYKPSEGPHKVFYVQLADGEKFADPSPFMRRTGSTSDVHLLNPKQKWSEQARLFPFEDKGILQEKCAGFWPMKELATAIFKRLPYSGWVSFEVSSASAMDNDARTPLRHVRRAVVSWNKLIDELES